MSRVISATFTIFISFFLGALAFAFVGVSAPELMESLFDGAGYIKDSISQSGLDPQYNVWVRFLIEESQIVYMGFVIGTRIVISVVFAVIADLIFGAER